MILESIPIQPCPFTYKLFKLEQLTIEKLVSKKPLVDYPTPLQAKPFTIIFKFVPKAGSYTLNHENCWILSIIHLGITS